MFAVCAVAANAQTKPRARDLGIRLEGTAGSMNAITDVAGVEVGHRTIVSGDNVPTGVTAVWPRGRQSADPVFGGFFSQNGNGDMTGTHWLEESGFLDGPVLITNTHSVGADAPLLPHQTKRLARRATMGLARTGATSGNGSGDIFIAFSSANPRVAASKGPANVSAVAEGPTAAQPGRGY